VITLTASRCSVCGDVRLPTVERCIGCRSVDLEPVDLDGVGRLLAVSEVHTPLRDGQPWTAVLVELGHGVRVVGLGRPPLAVHAAVGVVASDQGVPVFARIEGSPGAH
jgi:uncharacterized OB-fold protein